MSIQNYLNQIKSAVFGKDVRQSIHDAIKQCYDDASIDHDNANMEVKLARGSHDTLNERFTSVEENIKNNSEQLDNKANEVFQYQEDFCESIKRMYKPQKMSLKVVDSSNKVLSIVNEINDTKAIQYSTRQPTLNSTQDGYILIGEGRYGTKEKQFLKTGMQCADSMSGNWNMDYPPSYYATTVGDTMKKKFTGNRIEFQSFGDTRGGIWEFVLDGDVDNKVTLSTWQETSGVIPLRILFDNLEYKEHEVVGTFKGDDPEHTPSSGAGTSRGWTYYYTGEHATNSFHISKSTINVSNLVTPLYGSSNKEFAVEVRKKSTTNPYHFCPMHDVVTAFKINEPIFKINNNEVQLNTGDVYEDIKTFKIVQKINAINPESSDKLAEISTITTFCNDGSITVDGKYTALVDLDVNSAYGIMWMIDSNFNSKIVSSINKTYRKSDTPVGTNLYLTDEKDLTTSFISLSSDYPNVCTAVTFNNPKCTLRSGLGNKVNRPTWIEYRAGNTLTKLYQQVYGKTSINAGEIFRFSGTFIVAEIDNAYNLF